MGVEVSARRRKRDTERKQREEERWARRSGPVTSRIASPEELAALKSRKRGRTPTG